MRGSRAWKRRSTAPTQAPRRGGPRPETDPGRRSTENSEKMRRGAGPRPAFNRQGNPMSSNNKVAIVTGAGSGIGKAAALALLKEGYSVALAGRRPEMLEKAVAESGAGSRALAVVTDVSKPESVTALFDKT